MGHHRRSIDAGGNRIRQEFLDGDFLSELKILRYIRDAKSALAQNRLDAEMLDLVTGLRARRWFSMDGFRLL